MKRLKGIAASPGIAIGRSYQVQRTRAEVVYQEIIGPGQVVSQLHRLERAVSATEEELKTIKARVEKELPAQVYLIEAHLMMLKDQLFYGQARRLIEEEMISAEWAVYAASCDIAARFAAIDDLYLRNRIEDVEGVAERVLRRLAGQPAEDIAGIKEKGILVARNLSPADTTQIDTNWVMGLVTAMGTRTSHTAIVAQALEIPAVVGLEHALENIPSGVLIVIDGTSGEVVVDPDEETLFDYQERQARFESYTVEIRRQAHQLARTADGHRVSVLANIEQADEAVSALDLGAEGIGLFRTEFLYLSRQELPTEEQLYLDYRQVVERMSGRPVTIRTLDLGGDKFAHHFDLVPEMNPAMGLRAVRLCLRRPDIFKTQLRAILRASAHGRVRIMFPMISGIGEMLKCRQTLQECLDELRSQGLPYDAEIAVGCMMEVPSAVIIADLLARHVDFFSIGTNDLIQYSLAIDRVNEYVAHMYQPFHPGVLRMISATIEAARKRGIPVAMCGEMAGEPLSVPLLLGLGLEEVSVNPQAVPWVKRVIRSADRRRCRRLAKRVMAFETEAQVSEFINQELGRFFPDLFSAEGQMIY